MPDPIITNQRQLRTDPKETLDLLGTLLDEEAKRDAVHIAVLPVVAGEELPIGWHVGMQNGKAYHSRVDVANLGIVDPYLTDPVSEGQRFFLFLYPRKISSLRHVWSHPEIPDEVQGQRSNVQSREDIAASEAWLRNFAETSGGPSYYTLMAEAARRGDEYWEGHTWDGESNEYLHFGEDAHGEIPPEFWDHVEIVTGRTIPRERRAVRFSCAC